MFIKKLASLCSALLLIVATMLPATALADDPNGPNCAIPLSSQQTNGVNSPTGSDSSTYTYNCTTGLWENDYYTWSPVTHVTTPKYSQAYVFNPATGMWESTTWTYSPAQGKFVASVTSLSQDPYAPPAPAVTGGGSISGTGANSTNGITNDPNSNINLNTDSNAQLNNTLTQGAASGNIVVNANTTTGNSTSGNALNVTDVINCLSQGGACSTALPGVQTFTANIQGDVNGDLLINPGAIGSQNASSPNCGCAPNTNLTVNSQTTGSINNNINSGANSGNVDVTQNTTAGNATSGTATAIANVVNLLNSMISAGQSFIGVVNIDGNMNGNIYIPNNLVDQLLANNVPSTTLNLGGNSSLNANLTNNQAINNTVTNTATSGNVTSSENTTAGNATSGSATNTVRVFNLTGRQIVDANTLMVFINVAGQWVGFLMDPSQAGVTAAALGGGVTQNCLCGGNNNTNINASNTGTINNNINLAAQSGNVNASQNTTVGNLTSGDASTAANLLNINNSGLSSSAWFGILFINILGNWHGNFCANTTTVGCQKAISGGMGGGAGSNSGPQVFHFLPSTISNTGSNSHNFILNKVPGSPSSIDNTGANSKNVIINGSTQGPKGPTSSSAKWIIPVVTTLVGLALLGTEQLMDVANRQRVSRQLKTGFGQVAHGLRMLLF